MKKQYYADAKCPICGKEHRDVTAPGEKAVPWTGHVKPRINCKECVGRMKSYNLQQRFNKGSCKGQERSIWGFTKERGMTEEERRAYDLVLELEGRRWREKFGVQAPAHHWYIKGQKPVYARASSMN